jgi:uncharacterized membrane protein YqgA involved in biofilm formation
MIATVVNAIAIIIGTLIGLVFKKGFSKRATESVYNATGIISLVIGFSMALGGRHILAMALSIIFGGLIGTALDVEGAIYRLGEFLRKRFARTGTAAQAAETAADGSLATDAPAGFAYGFLNASVLFCVGAMALVGSFKAGTEGDYSLLLTKSVMDGFIAIMFAGAMGIGVGFSALSVLVYQGALTLLSSWIRPFVSEAMITELSAVGGALVVMIGINLLGLKKIRTGDFLPALAVIVVLALLFDYIPIL